MENNKSMRKLSSKFDVCQVCRMALLNCICSEAPNIKTDLNFYILTSEKEIYRPSNTAKLLKLASDSNVKIIKWERKNISDEIKKLLNSGEQVYLVYPSENEIIDKVEADKKENKINLIILDGTWNETNKILRKSEYLQKLPRISIDIEEKTNYELRKGAGEGELCTIEVIMELFKKYSEYENSRLLKEYFNLFKRRYFATLCGHKEKM